MSIIARSDSRCTSAISVNGAAASAEVSIRLNRVVLQVGSDAGDWPFIRERASSLFYTDAVGDGFLLLSTVTRTRQDRLVYFRVNTRQDSCVQNRWCP